MMVEISGGISPATADYITKTLDEAQEGDYSVYILKLNTPGGLLESTRDITTEFLESEIPTVVYVGPSGARAGSAGAFISMSADIVAMAPGTNIGAAHPVGLAGESDDSTDVMTQKVTNDASALIRSLAKKKGRDVQMAESMVRLSTSISEDEALDVGIADFIAKNDEELVKKLSGFSINNETRTITLNRKIELEERELGWNEEFLLWLADPNIAYIFILLAGYGFLIELYNPGSIFPGAIGVVSALLAAYSLGMLPVNWIGFSLLIASGILILLEVFITSYGLLSLGAVVTFFIGSTMLFDSPTGAFDISMDIIISLTALLAVTAGLVVFFAVRSQSKKKVSGKESLQGETGRALTDIPEGKTGKIRFHGENWKAINTDENIQRDDKVLILKTENLTAFVKRIGDADRINR
jgi:membrane-bound serine protease (ClpP class)